MGHVMLMLVLDGIIYFLITLYVEAIFPGEYGVPQPWYFPFTASYWCGESYKGKSYFSKIYVYYILYKLHVHKNFISKLFLQE